MPFLFLVLVPAPTLSPVPAQGCGAGDALTLVLVFLKVTTQVAEDVAQGDDGEAGEPPSDDNG